MKKIKSFNASEFPLNKDLKSKEGKKIYVVFSTFGEREAELIYEKITLLKNELGDYIDKIFLSHRRENQWEELTEKKALEAASDTEIIICNDLHVPDMGKERGKGADMRRTLYHINCDCKGDCVDKDIIVVFLDTDVVTEHFGSHFVLGLSGAVLSGFDFAKASFWRAMGRVKKFVAQPLFSVVQHPVISELRNMAYPLSGEVAGTLEFFNTVSFWQMYGVETGINVDSLMMDFKVADVNLGLYDHEHHGDINIQKMSFGIMRTFLIQLKSYGIIEFKDGAEISNNFKASRIDEQGNREKLDFDLSELKYEPLKKIF